MKDILKGRTVEEQAHVENLMEYLFSDLPLTAHVYVRHVVTPDPRKPKDEKRPCDEEEA